MKNQEFYKLLKKNKPNSGFTLTELLVGIAMSGIVVGAFGFGLMQVLRISRGETSKINARTETARAMEFITEEIKRASVIEANSANANALFDDTDKTVVLALDIPDITDNINLGADSDASTSERIVYYLEDASGNWRGPQVLYRWGPPLDEDGNYTDGTWQAEALIDALDNQALGTNPCDTNDLTGDTLSPATGATNGFHACISPNIAQLFFSGITKDAQGNYGESYSANTKVFVRARNSTLTGEETIPDNKLYFKTLASTYNCKVDQNNPSNNLDWKVRTDFGNNPNDSDDTTPWIHEEGRQPQPIDVDTSKPLAITTSAVGQSGCLSRGNNGTSGGEDLSTYTNSISFTIDFDNPATFNGTGGNPDVKGDGTVKIYKKGDIITEDQGYDFDNDGISDQESLGEFLEREGYAICNNGSCSLVTDAQASADPTKKALADNERIIAIELGQTDPTHPGFDVQDSVFILSNNAFDEE